MVDNTLELPCFQSDTILELKNKINAATEAKFTGMNVYTCPDELEAKMPAYVSVSLHATPRSSCVKLLYCLNVY
jgi:hypothetical protein